MNLRINTCILRSLLLLVTALSCKNQVVEKEIEPKKEIEPLASEVIEMMDFPKKDTQYDTLYTQKTANRKKLIQSLESILDKNGFNFKTGDTKYLKLGFSYCEENKVLIIRGSGVQHYIAKSRKPHSKGSKWYPYISINTYEFKNEKVAQEYCDILSKALENIYIRCNVKGPQKIVANKNVIFYLSSGAEMYRPYIEKYGTIIQNL